ncbi:MAG TPA: M50 family metallopeptidase [Solirubrobacteraceae bacterium]|nr:M50 family metallopeptidase [Solirubrobacteraceae bacterium]
MSYFLAFAGFAALIVLHEFGHFLAAKAVGMRVERFSLFFPPLLARVKRGETEYAIGAIPLGGYVKISGMNPHEELAPEVAPRAYFRQAPWKRIVVIAAGPLMNVLVAFAILWGLFLANGQPVPAIDRAGLRPPAAQSLRPGDHLVAVDGHAPNGDQLAKLISSHHCSGRPFPGCRATSPVRITVRRNGRLQSFAITPRYDPAARRTRIGVAFTVGYEPAGLGRSARLSLDEMWNITSNTASAIGRIFESKQRKQLSGVVGIYTVTQQAFALDVSRALEFLALISLSLALINLFPFLPLDGGHIFWAIAEKLRGRPISFSVLERASVVGFMLVLLLAYVGLSNDIGQLTGSGIKLR